MSRWLVCAAVVCLAVSAAPAQTPDVPTPPAPRTEVGPMAPYTLPAPAAVPERPAAYVLPPVDAWSAPPLPSPDPLLDRPGAPLPGLFFNVEPDVVSVHFRNQFHIAVPVSATQTDTVQFPGPHLDAALSSRFEVGWRLDDGWGELLVAYRFLCTQGSNVETTSAGPARDTGRLALNAFDFGYASQEFALGSDWDMRWRTGVRTTFFYYDARLAFDQPAAGAGALLGQGETNYFVGVGPWLALDLSWKTSVPGLAVFGRIDGALQFGHISQTGAEVLAGPAGASEFQATGGWEVTVLSLSEEVGLSYTVPGWNYSRFLIGFHYETYFQLGRFNPTSAQPPPPNSRGQLDDLGVFLRAEFNF